MQPILLVAGVVGALLAAVALFLRSSPLVPPHPGRCRRYPDFDLLSADGASEDPIDGECFFSSSYKEASQRFLAYARHANAEVWEMPVVDDLTTQVAVLRGDPHRFLVHLSGTHGVEAYAGSAIQLAALHELAPVYRSGAAPVGAPTMVFVHALNPYGFHHIRRTNEDNIDLNRNFLTDEEFAFVRGRDPNYAHYVEFDHFLNPTTKPTGVHLLDELLSVYTLLYTVLVQHGIGAVKTAMVSGNYHKQQGYGFGGFRRARSTDNLIALLTQTLALPTQAEQVVLLDVHTGLGPSGVDTLMFMQDSDLEDVFPTDRDARGRPIGALKANSFRGHQAPAGGAANKDAAAAAAGYELTVGTTDALCATFATPALPRNQSLCVTQEFGTVPSLVVGKHALDENYAHFWGSAADREHYRRAFLPCFYVQSQDWKRSVARRGLLLVQQAVAHLSRAGR